MAINPNEAPEGYVAVEGSGCKDCALKDCSVECWYAECGASIRKDGHCVIFVKKPDDGKATASWPYSVEDPAEKRANTNLIAAAPELLDFVKNWLSSQGSDDNYMTAKARAIIAKATGESE